MNKPDIKKTELDNGIRIVTDSMPHVRSVSIGIWIKAGSCDENLDNNGISHFLEHMLFKGTKSRSVKDIAQSLEKSGGSLNGFTGREVSCYTAFVLDENVPVALDVLSDILQNSILSEKEIRNEKQVIISEINHYRETPDEMVVEYFYEQLFPNHPLGYAIYGTPENVRKLTSKELRQFLKQKYTAPSTVVAAAGNLDHDRIVNLVQNKFNLPQTIHKNPPFYPSDSNNSAREILSNSSQQAHICVGTLTFPYSSEKKYPLIILEILLGGGMSSRLFQNIREKYGFSYNIYSFSDFMVDTGVLGFYLACAPDKVEKSLELLHKEFAKVRVNSISTDELNATKSQIKGSILLSLESSSRRMRRIGEHEIYDSQLYSVDEIIKKIDETSKDDVIAIAEEYLSSSQLTTTIIKPNNGN